MIIPALLTDNVRVAKERIALAQQMSGWLHVDVLDNSLYPFTSLSLHELSQLDYGSLLLEVHCMTNAPEALLGLDLPLERVVVHYELKTWEKSYIALTSRGIDTWVALAPETKLRTLSLPSDVAGIMIMGVEPGQSGQSFLPATLARVEECKDYYPDTPVTVDGGVSESTIRSLIAHGVDNLIMGSAIFQQQNPVEAYRKYVHISDPIGGAYDYQAA